MADYVRRDLRYGNPAPVAVDMHGFTHQVPSYRPGNIWGELYDAVCGGLGALKEIPGMLYMGKNHGVEHKAKKGKWTERNPNNRKAKMNGNNGKKGGKR